MNSKPIAGGLVVLPRYTNVNRIPIGRPRPGDIARDIVAEVNGGGGLTGETDGDKLATLFAAAPELLAALNGCVEWMEFTIEQLATHDKGARLNWGGPLSKARTAIAKATGGKPETAPTSQAPSPDRPPDALVTLQECVDLLKDSRVRFKICDGGRGNLGEAARYHSAMNKAHAVLYPTR